MNYLDYQYIFLSEITVGSRHAEIFLNIILGIGIPYFK